MNPFSSDAMPAAMSLAALHSRRGWIGETDMTASTLLCPSSRIAKASSNVLSTPPENATVTLPSRRRILLSDTVGFIRNLPHTLVTSFRATLEEVVQAEVLLHIRDAASTYGEEQKRQVEKVLEELDSLTKPRIEVLNKIDLLGEHERDGLEQRQQAGGEVAVSGHAPVFEAHACSRPSTTLCAPTRSSMRF